MATVCANCRQRDGTNIWTGEGGSIAYAHGLFVMWCDLCVARAQLEHAEKAAAQVPFLRARVATLSKNPLAPPPSDQG